MNAIGNNTLSIITAVFLDFDDAEALAGQASYLRELAESINDSEDALKRAAQECVPLSGQSASAPSGLKPRLKWILCIDNAEPASGAWNTNDLAYARERASQILYTGAAHSGAAKGRNLCIAQVHTDWMLPVDGDDHLYLSDEVARELIHIMQDDDFLRYGYIGCAQDLLYTEGDGFTVTPGSQSSHAADYSRGYIELNARDNDLARIWGDMGTAPFHSGNVIWNVEALRRLRGYEPWDTNSISENTVMLLEYSRQIDGLFAPQLTTKHYRCGGNSTTTSAHYMGHQDTEQADLAARLDVAYTELPRIDGAGVTKVPLDKIEGDEAGQRVLKQLNDWADKMYGRQSGTAI